jgi:hypothetical protein
MYFYLQGKRKRNRDYLDSSYSKAKLKLFIPPLEGGSKGGGLMKVT